MTELQAVALDIFSRLTTAERGLAGRAADLGSADELSLLWESPEAVAMVAVDEEAIAICQAAQAQADATADREAFADYPWISPELQEVVQVFFGCTKEERGEGS
jgi:hypothetical protein